MKAAIVMLCRGYPQVEYFGRLIERNKYIYERFAKPVFNGKLPYPLIIFHEGNIPLEHQGYIRSHTPELDIVFKDIGYEFKWPAEIKQEDIVDLQHFHPGYRLMCRFACYQIWKHVAEYDYVWRIDEDTLLGEIHYDPFAYMQEKGLDYLYGRVCYETHQATNETIPAAAHQLLAELWFESDYEQNPMWVPYTNLYIARVGLFMRPDVQTFLNRITNNPMFLTHRWGDHVVSGIVLKAFSEPELVSFIPDFTYYHGSHQCITVNGRAVQGILSLEEAEAFDCVPTGNPSQYIARELANAGRSA